MTMKLQAYKKERNKTILYAPYITLGDPSLKVSVEIASTLIEAGADILELGIPFSDPTADGPIIQCAMERALAQKSFNIENLLEATKQIHTLHPHTPLYFLVYANSILNIILNYGKDSSTNENKLEESAALFYEKCKQIGVRGLIIPDLPFDSYEAHVLAEVATTYDIHHIHLITPTTSTSRLSEICEISKEWIYCTTSLGVTGLREELPHTLLDRIQMINKKTDALVFAGFGIQSEVQIFPFRNIVGGIIVGSRNQEIVSTYNRKDKQEMHNALFAYTQKIVRACI